MTQIQVVYPLRSGTQERWRRLCQEVGEAHSEAFAASCQHMGILSGEVRLVHALNRDVMVVNISLSSSRHAVDVINVLTRSDDPADRWLRAQLQSVLGWTLQAMPTDLPSDVILSWGR